MNESLIVARGLTKTYSAVPALDHIDLTIGSGRIVGLLGPNGSGKTTFIKLLCGLLQPTSGILTIDEHAPGIHTKSVISYLPDRMYFADWMKTCDLTDFFADFDKAKANAMLADLKLEPLQRIGAMSKGTQEKMQLCLTMSRQAKLYLLDEPLGGVDPAAREYIMNTILRNYSEDAAVVISTHLIDDIEKVLDEVLVLKEGRLLLQSGVDELREERGQSLDEFFRDTFRC